MGIIKECLQDAPVSASAPCRIDMGGTLDLTTFSLPMQHLKPCTFNAALDMRTHVRLEANDTDKVMIHSHGFDPVEVDLASAPFTHPLGLMIAVAAYFNAEGVRIHVESTSPPRSALGGSSVAEVALIHAFHKALAHTGQPMPQARSVALLAFALEQSVAGVHCGIQDHLAAAFGGMNVWYWTGDSVRDRFSRQRYSEKQTADFADRIMVAYCGLPHVSADINGDWVRGFLSGRDRSVWSQIVSLSRNFTKALAMGEYGLAAQAMNQETDLRTELTPEVLDDTGTQLVATARQQGCGARFCGAGGGGCIWALGDSARQITSLRSAWLEILDQVQNAKLLETKIDFSGIL